MSDQERRRLTGGPVAVESAATLSGPSYARASWRPVNESPLRGASDFERYRQILRNRWRIFVGVFGVVFLSVSAGTLLQERVYRASGTIEIRKPGAEVVPIEALFQSPRLSDQYLETQYGILRSPALARRVVEELGLVEEFGSGGRRGALDAKTSTGPGSEEVLERAVEQLRGRLTIDPITGSQLVGVRYESEDPELAARVVNSVLDHYIAMRADAGHKVVTHLAAQVDSIRANLAQAEARLQDYERANGLFVVQSDAAESESIPLERLRRLQQELTDAEAARYERESLYQLLPNGGAESLDSEVLQALAVRVAELRGEYARLRSTFTDEYPRTAQVKRQLDELQALYAQERQRAAAEIRNEYRAALRRQELLQNAFTDQQERIDSLGANLTEHRILQREVESHRQLYTALQQKRLEGAVSAALAATEVDILDRAAPPQEPIRPVPSRNLPLAAVIGLVLGLSAVFLREYMDNSVTTLDEVDSSWPPVLAHIPSIRSLEEPQRLGLIPVPGKWLPFAERTPAAELADPWHRIDQHDPQRAALAEAFGGLRTSVLRYNSGSSPRSLVITSAQPGEGKTTVSINLAISLAWLGKRVLLIDADLRRPSVHRALGIADRPGLGDYLCRAGTLPFVQSNVVAGLDVLTAGTLPVGPSEMLSSSDLQHLIRASEESYDFVILDSPALFVNAPDAQILAPLADGVVLVVRSGITPRELVRRALNQVQNLTGVVLNDVDFRRHFPAYYHSFAGSNDGVEDARMSRTV